MDSNNISNDGRIVHRVGYEPYPADPLGQKLCQVFSYLWQAIVAPNQPSPDWETLTKHPLRPRTLWAKWQDSARLVGVRFRDMTFYALLDIDFGSVYCNAASIREIRYALETIGITRTILIRSSYSGGFHLYIPLGVQVPTFGLASAIKQTLEAQGLTVALGTLEVFPNCKAYAIPGTFSEYNAHRLPLQPASGSCLLDGDCQPEAYGDGYNGLREFFQRWEVAASSQDMDLLRQAIAQARLSKKKRNTKNREIVTEWEADLKREIEEGWTDHGQTNHLLKTIACYGLVFLKYKDDALAEYVETTALNAPGFEEWCGHQENLAKRANAWAKAAQRYYWCLGDEPTRQGQIFRVEDAANTVVSFNLSRSNDSRERIKSAVRRLEAEGRFPTGITERANLLIREAGVSLRTLYKEENQELWKTGCRPVIPIAVGVSEDSTRQSEGSSETPKVNDDGKLPTWERLMKGGRTESPSLSSPFQIASPTKKGSVCNESLRDFGDCQHPTPPP